MTLVIFLSKILFLFIFLKKYDIICIEKKLKEKQESNAINKKTSEFEILDCIDFDSSSILIQAGSGTMLMNYDENEYEVEKAEG